jgi:hypothetical protein
LRKREARMGIFDRPSKRSRKADSVKKDLKRLGYLDPPDRVISYECECGAEDYVNLRGFNVVGGAKVTCSHCGAVLLIPSRALDHTQYSPQFKGATLKPNWREMTSFVKHGTK